MFGGIAPGWSATLPLTKIMEGRTAIKRGSPFDKMNRICELETAKAFSRQLQATLAEKRGVMLLYPDLVFAVAETSAAGHRRWGNPLGRKVGVADLCRSESPRR